MIEKKLKLNKFGYDKWGGVFLSEIFSNDKSLPISPNNDESYSGDYCLRVKVNKSSDVVFLSSVYNNFLDENRQIQFNKTNESFIRSEIKSMETKLTNCSYIKNCSLVILEREMNKWGDLKEQLYILQRNSHEVIY